MNAYDAEKIADTIIHADGGCSHCRDQLAVVLNEKFPEFDWLALARAAQERDDARYRGES